MVSGMPSSRAAASVCAEVGTPRIRNPRLHTDAQRLHKKGCRAAGAQPDHHAVGHIGQGAFGGFLLKWREGRVQVDYSSCHWLCDWIAGSVVEGGVTASWGPCATSCAVVCRL